jgi:hypothetical protein
MFELFEFGFIIYAFDAFEEINFILKVRIGFQLLELFSTLVIQIQYLIGEVFVHFPELFDREQ